MEEILPARKLSHHPDAELDPNQLSGLREVMCYRLLVSHALRRDNKDFINPLSGTLEKLSR